MSVNTRGNDAGSIGQELALSSALKLVCNWLILEMAAAQGRSVGAFEAKTHLAALLDAVSAGERITITRHGKPVARLVPASDSPPADIGRTINALKQLSQGQRLAGVSVQALRDAGRR